MHHDLHAIAAPRAPQEPQAEPDVQRSIAEAVRHPLNEQAAGWRKAIEQAIDRAQIAPRDASQHRMHGHAVGRRPGQRRTPHVDVITGRGQSFSDDLTSSR